MADAFTRVFPELVRLVLPQGVIDLDSITPLNDVVLIGTTVKVTIFIHKLSSFSCRQWWKCTVGQISFSAPASSPTLPIQSTRSLPPRAIFTNPDHR
jgi:hypothetical protein